MGVYCTEGFIIEYQKLIKKKQYNCLENLFFEFINSSFDNMATGNVLYGPDFLPFLKKRIPDAGGYRFYFLADFKTKNIYLNFIHAKRQPLGYDNISTTKKKELHDAICVSRSTDNGGCFTISKCPDKGIAIFTPIKSLP